MNFIKKSIEKRADEVAHLQFQKFSKGEFSDRAAIVARFAGGKYTISTGPEFAADLVKIMAEKLGHIKTKITGIIVSTSNLSQEMEFKDVSQFQGVKRYALEKEMTGHEILEAMKKFKGAFFGISFSVGEDILKIKAKAPKSGKPGKNPEDGVKADFCKLITKDKKIIEDFVFESKNFKKAEISHKFLIERIVIPEQLRDSKDFAKIREESKRAGKIIRRAKIDDQIIEKTYDFEA